MKNQITAASEGGFTLSGDIDPRFRWMRVDGQPLGRTQNAAAQSVNPSEITEEFTKTTGLTRRVWVTKDALVEDLKAHGVEFTDGETVIPAAGQLVHTNGLAAKENE